MNWSALLGDPVRQPAVIDQTSANAPAVISSPAPRSPGTTANGIVKFLIGFLAGTCAVIFPRFLALLAQSDDLDVTFFPRGYLVLAIILGLVIGVVIVIFEYQVFDRQVRLVHVVLVARGDAPARAGEELVADAGPHR